MNALLTKPAADGHGCAGDTHSRVRRSSGAARPSYGSLAQKEDDTLHIDAIFIFKIFPDAFSYFSLKTLPKVGGRDRDN